MADDDFSLSFRKITELDGLSGNEHVLGFRKSSEALLTEMTKSSSVPVVLRSAEASGILSGDALKIFSEEVHVSNLYETVRSQKSGQPFRNVLTKPLIVV